MRHSSGADSPIEVFEAGHPRLLLNCIRQAGKSTVVALLGLAEALFVPFTKVLLVSRSFRQSTLLYCIVTDFYRRLGSPQTWGWLSSPLDAIDSAAFLHG